MLEIVIQANAQVLVEHDVLTILISESGSAIINDRIENQLSRNQLCNNKINLVIPVNLGIMIIALPQHSTVPRNLIANLVGCIQRSSRTEGMFGVLASINSMNSGKIYPIHIF